MAGPKANGRTRTLDLSKRPGGRTAPEIARHLGSSSVAVRADGFVLAEHNCPIIDVAQRFPQACQCEHQLFERLLNANLRRETSRAEGASVCRYHVEAR